MKNAFYAILLMLLIGVSSGCGDSGSTGNASTGSSGSSYLESCRQWNSDHPEQYTDPEQCAADAEQMASDAVDYLSENP